MLDRAVREERPHHGHTGGDRERNAAPADALGADAYAPVVALDCTLPARGLREVDPVLVAARASSARRREAGTLDTHE